MFFTNFCVVSLRPGSRSETGREGFPGGLFQDGQTCGFTSPEAGGFSQPQRAADKPRNSSQLKLTGPGIEPGFTDCEATVLPRRPCAPLQETHTLHQGSPMFGLTSFVWPTSNLPKTPILYCLFIIFY